MAVVSLKHAATFTEYWCCVTALDHTSEELAPQVEKLRDCISVLFGFHRRPTRDAEFVENIRKWTERLVSASAVCIFSGAMWVC